MYVHNLIDGEKWQFYFWLYWKDLYRYLAKSLRLSDKHIENKAFQLLMNAKENSHLEKEE